MKRILVCIIAGFGLVAYAETQTADAPKAKPGKTAKQQEVTGSKIPTKADKSGRPVKHTLKVETIDQEAVRIFGLGSPSGALARIPYVYLRGSR